jgi:hypothetical protein
MGLTPIGTDYNSAQGANVAAQQQAATKTSFFDKLQYATAVAGPAVAAGVNQATGGNSYTMTTAGMAVSAAVNASQGGSGTATLGYSGGMGLTAGGTGGAYSTGTTGSSTGGMAGNVESILQDTAASQAYLLGIQMEMGNNQTMFTSVSNALNVKHSMMKSVINNFRVG